MARIFNCLNVYPGCLIQILLARLRFGSKKFSLDGRWNVDFAEEISEQFPMV